MICYLLLTSFNFLGVGSGLGKITRIIFRKLILLGVLVLLFATDSNVMGVFLIVVMAIMYLFCN